MGIGCVGVIFSMTCTIILPLTPTVGINSDGVFARGYGVVLWKEIKSFGLVYDKFLNRCYYENNIYITLHNPDDFFDRLTTSWWFRRPPQRMTQGRIKILGNMVSMDFQDLLNLLQESHSRYSQQ